MKTVYTSFDGNDTIKLNDDGIYIREIKIDCNISRRITVGLISDIHFNYCNEEDFKIADPVLMSTYTNRLWNKNAATVPVFHNCLNALGTVDKLVLNGDTMDYLSCGALELMQTEVFDKLPDVIATVGGHECAVRMQGEVAETTSLSQRLEILQKHWKHNIYYTSQLISGKVLLIGFLNDRGTVCEYAYEKLKSDISAARENGYTVLLFAHEPIATQNSSYADYTEDFLITKGDTNGFPCNFETGEFLPGKLLGAPSCDDVSRAAYKLITDSADVVKGFFAGHFHNDFYLDINARLPNGTAAIIPQYVTTASAYDNGHVTKIVLE